jgi:hypothetical protein
LAPDRDAGVEVTCGTAWSAPALTHCAAIRLAKTAMLWASEVVTPPVVQQAEDLLLRLGGTCDAVRLAGNVGAAVGGALVDVAACACHVHLISSMQAD